MKYSYQEETKERLDKFLANSLDSMTRSQIKRAILAGKIRVNGEIPTVHEWLHKGDIVEFSDEEPEAIVDIIEPKIIEQTDDFLIISKPSGLLVHPTARGETNTLVHWLFQKYPQIKSFGDQERPGLVHRLDKDVSGIMVIALNEQTYSCLKEQFQNRSVEKHYTALVHGAVLNADGEIRTNLERDKKTGKVKAYSDRDNLHSGQQAITRYTVSKRYIKYSLLDVQIITGRTHQIRVHLASIGHSIVGDRLYATRDIRKSKKNILNRPFLHSTHITFTDCSGEEHLYTDTLPEDLTAFLNTLK